MPSLRHVALALAIPTQLVLAQQAPSSNHALTLDDAITQARQNNPALQQVRELVHNADATVRSAYGALLPNVSASLGTNYTQGGTQYYQGVALGSSGDTYSSNYRLGVNYSIAASALFAPRAARANRSASEASVTSNSELLRSNVTTQYIQALEQEATAAVNDTLVQTAQGQLDLAKAKVQVGSGTILDVRIAEVALGQAEVAALQAHNMARIEKLKLFQLMGVPADSSVQLTTKFVVTAPPSSVDSLLRLARSVNPDLAAKRSTEYADQMQVRMNQTAYLPSLAFSTGLGGNAFGYASNSFVAQQAQASALSGFRNCSFSDSIRVGAGLAPSGGCGSPTLTSDELSRAIASNRPFSFQSAPMSFAASISVPIFNNFLREQQLEQARVSHQNATYDVKARELQLTTDVTTAYLNLVTAAKTVELQTTTAQQAAEALAFADESYKVGSKTFLDVTTARGQYEQAAVGRVNAIYDYHKAFAALEQAVGRPLR